MYDDQHANAVRLLEDQQNLDELLKPSFQIFEPCVIIGDRSKLVIREGSRIDSMTKIEVGNGVRVGRGVHIASFAHIGIGGGETIIGDYAAVASGGKVISGSNQLTAHSMSPLSPCYSIVRGRTELKPFSCVLTNATVCPGVTLGFGAILMPGGVANHDIPEWEVWGGTPAKFIKKRRFPVEWSLLKREFAGRWELVIDEVTVAEGML